MNRFLQSPSLAPSAPRRLWLKAAAASSLGLALPLRVWGDDDNDGDSAASANLQLHESGIAARVVVVGGGMAGAAAAKYLRLWGGSRLEVILVEPDASYTSNIMSNLVLNGSRSLASLQYSRQALATRYGVTLRSGSLAAIASSGQSIRLSDGSSLAYDKLVLAPGVEFMDAYGLTAQDYELRTPHAWQAGAQTQLLAQQLGAMKNGDVLGMTIPKAPYRCPPGPYERACLIADTLKTTGRAASKVLVLDENLSIQAEKETFAYAFGTLHAGVIDYQSGVSAIAIDPQTRVVNYTDALGASHQVTAQVVNPIVPHRARGSGAGGWMAAAGLNNSSDGRWAMVNVLNYESTARPHIHIIGDACSAGLPKAGHVGNQEGKICADALIRVLGGQSPDPAPVANSACYSPITASTASWLTAVYQYDAATGKMLVANNGGQTSGASATESASISASNYQQMGTWFNTLMSDTLA